MRLVFGPEVGPLVIRMIENAKHNVLLITPYLDPWPHLVTEIRNAVLVRKLPVTLVLRGGSDRARQEQAAASFVEMGVRVRFVERLHAKIYVCDDIAIVTSLNLLKSSVEGSWEVATVFRKQSDPQAYRDLTEAAKRLGELIKADQALAEAETKPPAKPRPPAPPAAKGARKTLADGHCIRCGEGIPLAPNRPMCRTCYTSWAAWENPDYPEKHCHGCGKPHGSSMAKPLCKVCFRKMD